MSAINMETFRTGTFDFYIGPDEILFTLYKSLVSRYSEPLGRMMSNRMKESQEGKAFLKHVDPDTFCRFAEFIHSGDYSAAPPVEVLSTPEEYPPEAPAPPPEEDYWGFSSKKKKKKKARMAEPEPEPVYIAVERSAEEPVAVYPEDDQNWDIPADPPCFAAETQTTLPPPPPFPVDPAPGLNESPTMCYTQTFACHISVHHFAEVYLVTGLKELARQKLSETLNMFRCFSERTGDICHIVRLVYNHEDGDAHPSPLHAIISDYATNNFKTLTASIRFKVLLAEGGLFPPDVCSKVARLLR